MKNLITILCLSLSLNLVFGCIDGEEVELWGECYNIETTTELDLSFNELTGEIPEEIGNLINLQELRLNSNQLIGEIPSEIGNLTNLWLLSLSSNQLIGGIPPEIGNLTNLTHLYLGENQLMVIPPEIGNMTNLEILSLTYNEFTEIPPEIGNMTNLTNLYLYQNQQLTGEIPSEIGNLTNLEDFDCNYCQFTGEIPEEIGNLINLQELRLSSNQLIGEIPSEICNLNLSSSNLSLGNNQLCPPYPSCVDPGYQDTSSCEYYECDEGFVELWNFCYEIQTTTNLDLSSNQISGEIPPEIGSLINLTTLNLEDNQFTGEIPTEIGNFTNLQGLYLRSNQLEGEIPSEICNNNYVYVGNNRLCPPYPECISQSDIDSQDTSECENLSNSDYTTKYSLNKPYPNPFNPTTTISFSVPNYDFVSIKVYDINGGLISTLVENHFNQGTHSLTWDGTNLSSGQYLVKMESGSFSKTQIVSLIK